MNAPIKVGARKRLSRDGYEETEIVPPTRYMDMDLSSARGAKWLASRIKRFWDSRGGIINVWTEEVTPKGMMREGVDTEHRSVFVVKSDLGPTGLPRKWKDDIGSVS